jgi:hypothetical protein
MPDRELTFVEIIKRKWAAVVFTKAEAAELKAFIDSRARKP